MALKKNKDKETYFYAFINHFSFLKDVNVRGQLAVQIRNKDWQPTEEEPVEIGEITTNIDFNINLKDNETFSVENLDKGKNNIIKLIYEEIKKENPFFEGWRDC